MNEHVPPNLRAIRILEVLSESRTAPTPTELNARLGWPKQTIHRLCQTLIEAGILEKHDRRLYPGHRASLLATGLADRSAGLVGCHQILLQVARDSGETVNFVRPEPRGMNYIDRVETNWAFRVALPIGTQVPFHCTASGKLFMASLPAARRRAFLSSLQMHPQTPNTFTDPVLLADELSEIRRCGFSLDREEFHEGMVAIAVPVTDPQGRFYAALAIHGPTQRFSIDDAMDKRAMLQGQAARMGELLFTPPTA